MGYRISEVIARDGIVVEPEFVDELSVVFSKSNVTKGKKILHQFRFSFAHIF